MLLSIQPFSHVCSELLPHALREATHADRSLSRSTANRFHSPNATIFSCGHVVPPSHATALCLPAGPTSATLDFRHGTKQSDAVCDELGRVLANLVNVVPKGMVVFLPSYAYESFLLERWGRTGLLDRLERKKAVHREPKRAGDLDAALEAFARDALAGGAILFSVVGGKMSEGINFADDMARCVAVVGMPYPDSRDPELKEKMRLLDETRGGVSGRAYYHNLCMRAVNQSIGRAIRHSADYAAIVLLDGRYSAQATWDGLPSWLTGEQKVPRTLSFGKALFHLRNFYKRHERPVDNRIA